MSRIKKKSIFKNKAFILFLFCLVMIFSVTISLLISKKKYAEPEKTPEQIQFEEELAKATAEAEADLDKCFDTTDYDVDYTVLYNNKLLTCELKGNYELTIGTEDNSSNKEYLKLCPKITDGTKEKREYGLYIISDNSRISFLDNKDTETQTNSACSVFTERTYDSGIAAENTVWTSVYPVYDNSLVYDVIRFRVVDLKTRTIIGTAACDVTASNGQYELSNLRDTDIRKTEEFTDYQLNRIIDTAIQFLTDQNTGAMRHDNIADELDKYRDDVVIERSGLPYFLITLDQEHRCIYRYKVADFNSLAVSFRTDTYGTITVYLASEYRLKGYDFDKTLWNENPKYEAFGYDMLLPESREALICPVGFDIFGDAIYIN